MGEIIWRIVKLEGAGEAMISGTESTLFVAAGAGDHTAFERLTEPHRRELLVHCYRMLGSLEDAEDILQETLLRAWRKLDTFEGRASFRTWLYKIATNTSLDVLSRRRSRALPSDMIPAADPLAPFPPPTGEPIWLGPLPDFLIDERTTVNPEARYEAHESVQLAFLAALQKLPGRQRAVLILRDVLGWKASEVAELLGSSVEAANSALQRARATMKQYHGDTIRLSTSAAETTDEQIALLLAKYVAAWEEADSRALVALLREDALITMPPFPLWYQGPETIRRFLDVHLFKLGANVSLRLEGTRANGAPAFATYQQDAQGVYRPAAIQVITITDGMVARIDDFLTYDNRLFSQFGLPLSV
jgi:RNA polymerase sigma-70 factor (ECF subfamily)